MRKRFVGNGILGGMLVLILILFGNVSVYAEEISYDVDGVFMEFENGKDYVFSEAVKNTSTNSADVDTYGEFSVSGDIVEMKMVEGTPVYGVGSGNIDLFYKYSDRLLNTADEEWHLIEDKTKKIDDIKLDNKIGFGTIIVQTSKDGEKWVNTGTLYNQFKEKPILVDSFHTTSDTELSNGCYYRVIVAYELGMKTGKQGVAFVQTDKIEKKRIAEVYEFFVYSADTFSNSSHEGGLKYSLGSKQRKKHDSGYSEDKDIDVKDAHYGWDLGNFFVSGYTEMVEETSSDNGNPIFLKNVGDNVTLYFNLGQDIDCLNGDSNLSISEDKKGYDKYFETDLTNFGRGALIIRYTDPENIKHDPQIYVNYLAANLAPGADTVVQLCEEGDYEVALDYEIKKDPRNILGVSIIPEYYDYRIFFKFSVRSGNCMVYTFDLGTGSELSNKSVTESGFRIDLANSKYLDINVKKQILNDTGDEIVEDTRFNRPAKDGEEYTAEGVYIITAHNNYTNQDTEKTIYVGQDEILKAHIITGLTIPEIKELKKRGAVIDKNGNIDTTKIVEEDQKKLDEMTAEEESEEEVTSAEEKQSDDGSKPSRTNAENSSLSPIVIVLIIIVVILIGVVAFLLVLKSKKGKRD